MLFNRNKIRAWFLNSPAAQLNSIAVSGQDREFLDRLNSAIQEKMENPELDVDHLAAHLKMSRATLYRKIKSLSSLTPNDLINLTRLVGLYF